MALAESTEAAIEKLYQDALEIYERARREVTIGRSDGRRLKYAAVRYKQQIVRGHESGLLVVEITRIIKNRTTGSDHLEEARRPDLMLETLVLNKRKPYHRLFVANTVQTARQRMDEYWSRHPETG